MSASEGNTYLLYEGFGTIVCSTFAGGDCSGYASHVNTNYNCYIVRANNRWYSWFYASDAKCWDGACDGDSVLGSVVTFLNSTFIFVLVVTLAIRMCIEYRRRQAPDYIVQGGADVELEDLNR